MAEPPGYMTFDGQRFRRDGFLFTVYDDDWNQSEVWQGAVDAPLPDGHVVVRFVGQGHRELPVDALIVREGELWHMRQTEAEQRSGVVIVPQRPSKTLAPSAAQAESAAASEAAKE